MVENIICNVEAGIQQINQNKAKIFTILRKAKPANLIVQEQKTLKEEKTLKT